MFKAKQFFILVVLCAFLLSGSTSVGEGKEIVKGELGGKLDLYLTRITPFGFSGALLVAKDGEIVLNKGYGMAIRAKGIRNTAETVFSTGSITKQFTAAGIMKLEMQGKLNTNDVISEYLDGVPEDKAGITLHHLLTHTSGLVQDVGTDYDVAHRDETVKKILEQELEFEPGERFEYTNVGYTLLAAIIEKISGQAYEEYLNKNLFKPAGMAFTGYRMPEWDKKVVAHWYVGETDNGTPLEKPYPYWNLMGNGGILSTTEDMYKWHLALSGNALLPADAKKKLYTPFLNDYAYGWDVLKTERGTLIQHDGGSMLGNSAEIRRYVAAGVVTILFCNQSYGEQALFEAVRDKIENLAFGGDVVIPPDVIAKDPGFLRRFEGDYQLTSGGRLSASVENEALRIAAQGQDAINLLVFPDTVDLTLNKDLNDRSTEIFEAAIKGDYGPFGEVLANKEERFDRVREFIEMRIRHYEDMTGAIKKVEAVGTLPSSYEEGAVETIVELKGERESIFFGSIWLDEKNIGVRPVRSAQAVVVPFLPISESEFAGYDLSMARNVHISFHMTEEGLVSGLIIHGEKGDVDIPKIAP
jgi:CubicO group peptidase (beta-lactamase class C family)